MVKKNPVGGCHRATLTTAATIWNRAPDEDRNRAAFEGVQPDGAGNRVMRRHAVLHPAGSRLRNS